MNSVVIESPARWRQLDKLPIGLFGSVMGLTGLSIAWRLAHAHFGAPAWIADGIGVVAIAAFVAISLGYAVKLATAPDAVRDEFHHPIAGSLFGTLLISILLLPIIIAPVNVFLARVLWAIGAITMNAFGWLMISRWMSDRQQAAHATPTWIVPLVGLLDVPLAVPSLGLPTVIYASVHQLMVLDLAVGLFFAIPLFTMIFSRLLFDAPLPDALQATLLILVVPFSVGFSTYTVTTGATDIFAQALYLLSLFVLAVLLGRLRHLGRCCPFKLAWWSVSFPLASASIAALHYAEAISGPIADALALALLALATVVIAGLLVRTLMGLLRGELRTLSA
ncbi:SLAC1 anion channel family protein [Rhodanobacter sp. C05]|uniref:SLAC1 anion channel family protein n=1 Tax=Rhodanobacter sp. C05 TaxID=1945855 RepID=UPI00098591E2|nr:SLAC1 anion channel family protein [Rhodanobacter sp. C05]OOG41424.1 C4-dicarboxylate ABC transporter [Rhodanobacter sp. C05]